MPELSYSIFGTLSRDETFIKVSGDSNYPYPFCYLGEYFSTTVGFIGLNYSCLGRSFPGIFRLLWLSGIIRCTYNKVSIIKPWGIRYKGDISYYIGAK